MADTNRTIELRAAPKPGSVRPRQIEVLALADSNGAWTRSGRCVRVDSTGNHVSDGRPEPRPVVAFGVRPDHGWVVRVRIEVSERLDQGGRILRVEEAACQVLLDHLQRTAPAIREHRAA